MRHMQTEKRMRKLATIETVRDIQPIENADQIVKARVRDWWVVIRKDEFKTGDRVAYYEIDSFLPVKPEYEFLLKGSKIKKMLVDGVEREGIRLRTVKLRGQISQGLILAVPVELADKPAGYDCTQDLGVLLYEPPVPACLMGEVKGSMPSFIPKTDEERVQNIAEALSKYVGTSCYVTEKVDGTSMTVYKKDGIFGVAGHNWEYKETPDNTYWKIARALGLEEKLPDGYAIQGELVGEGIQKNSLKIKGHKFLVFNVYEIAHEISNAQYLDFDSMRAMVVQLGLELVPIVRETLFLKREMTAKYFLALAEGASVYNPNVKREGIVVRAKDNSTMALADGSVIRLSFKAISNEYLSNQEDI